MKKIVRNNKGLSLPEMIIALAIIVILVGAAGSMLVRYIEKSKLSKDVSNAKTIYSDVVTTIGEAQIHDELLIATRSAGADLDFTAPGGGAFTGTSGLALKTLQQYRPTTPAFNYTKNNPVSWVVSVGEAGGVGSGSLELVAHVYIVDGSGARVEVAPNVTGPYADVE